MHSDINLSDIESPFTNYIYSEKFHCSLIVTCSISIFLAKNIEYEFEQLLELGGIEPYGFFQHKNITINIDLWNTLNFFIHFDAVIPINLKLQLLELEVTVITELAWKTKYDFHKKITEMQSVINHYVKAHDNSAVFGLEIENKENIDIQNLAHLTNSSWITSKEQNDSKLYCTEEISSTKLYEAFFKRMLYQCAFTIYSLSHWLPLHPKQQEAIWATVKYILTSNISILFNNHLDQIILCTTYCISRAFALPFKFQDIIQCYFTKVNKSTKINKDQFIYQLQSGQNIFDIINFYNKIYLPQVRNYVQINIQSVNKQQVSPSQKTIINSPLAEIIPTSIQQSIEFESNKIRNNSNQCGLLYAFTESPKIKNDLLQVSKKLASQKILNFEQYDQQQQMTQAKSKGLKNISQCKNNYSNHHLHDISNTINNFTNAYQLNTTSKNIFNMQKILKKQN